VNSFAEFRLWFIDALVPLRGNPHAGFVFTIITFPLLERYLREKSGVREGKLDSKFYCELEHVFPEIIGRGNDFYGAYRNGLLHQAAFSLKTTQGPVRTLPKAGLSGYDPRPVYFDANTAAFYLNPEVFYQRVIDAISSDFATYEGASSPNHPLPSHRDVSMINPVTTITIGNVPVTGSAGRKAPLKSGVAMSAAPREYG
jgi:hypothetical protein